MFIGKKFADAIRKGVDAKIVRGQVRSKVEIARYFGIAGPSLHNWMDTGRVDRSKTPRILGYFKDVTTPDDWGLEEWPAWIVEPEAEDLDAAAENGHKHSKLARKADDLLHGLQELMRASTPIDEQEHQLLTFFRRLSQSQKEQVLVLINAMQK